MLYIMMVGVMAAGELKYVCRENGKGERKLCIKLLARNVIILKSMLEKAEFYKTNVLSFK